MKFALVLILKKVVRPEFCWNNYFNAINAIFTIDNNATIFLSGSLHSINLL